MTIAISMLMVILVLLAVLYPLFDKKDHIDFFVNTQSQNLLEKLKKEKANVLMTIREIDFDYETAKLSKEDYVELKDKYLDQAASILSKLEQTQQQWDKTQNEIDQHIKAL